MSNYSLFKELHQQNEPLLLGNAWNAASARILQENGIKAIGTSSSAIADTLGYEDGERIPFAELFFIVEKIAKQATVPLSADIERGYSEDVNVVVKHIEQLHDIGVVGINLEDSVQAEKLILGPTDTFRKKLAFIKNQLAQKNIDLFINVRTDTFLLQVPDALNETLARIKAYEEAGADSIFVPFIKVPADIRHVTTATSLPVNVLAMPDLPSFDILKDAGVKRISMGGSVYRSVNNHLKKVVNEISSYGSFGGI
ncbi:2-methylisocitrate lyase-like PEP mutase family enzyme [Chitinophaga niastensis]|uniref:2-methylisocitrate lyase-like PEP mutase family enzyme n=1 Tax=Chitinophaga niastensis TaxID=536980 RepID=A0A2P8HCJ7_CHINA|nr:isocitrate lyase/phosphoenolpyruvate mutase family protein [Chitinophaga niastensis]PSL43892.1 2-methylisocitrate lyase-like PEP mutase family enzyme [Chitinophaga niastensis]